MAHDSFEACAEHASEADSLLSALFVRAKRVHLLVGEIQSFHRLITKATQIILSERGQRALKDPFSLVQRIIIRLALLDARTSCYRLGGRTLIKALRHIPAMSFIVNLEGTDGSAPNALFSLLRADILHMKVGERRPHCFTSTYWGNPLATPTYWTWDLAMGIKNEHQRERSRRHYADWLCLWDVDICAVSCHGSSPLCYTIFVKCEYLLLIA